jgi:small conductance mechanosensitive channel
LSILLVHWSILLSFAANKNGYMNDLMNLNVDNYIEQIKVIVIAHGMGIAVAIVLLLVGLYVIKLIRKAFDRLLTRRGIDESLKPFLITLVSVILKVMLVITVIQMVGIQTTSFVAVLASAGLAIGLALSGTLQNFAGGVVLLVLKPFKKGDFIEAQGYTGTVDAIQLFTTVLKTPDNKTIFIPNGPLSTGSLVNFSAEATRRVDFSFGVSYRSDIDHVKSVLNRLIEQEERALKEPGHQVVLHAMADSSIKFTVRIWVNSPDYWPVFFDFNEKVKKAFDAEQIEIPYPQMDVHFFRPNK